MGDLEERVKALETRVSAQSHALAVYYISAFAAIVLVVVLLGGK